MTEGTGILIVICTLSKETISHIVSLNLSIIGSEDIFTNRKKRALMAL
jgi:hypothetical protein